MNQDYESMTEQEMNELCLEFFDSRTYQAMLKYVSQRDQLVAGALRTTDPFKEPTLIARSQGIRTGLFDFRDYILILKERTAAAEAAIEEQSKGGN